MSSKSYPELITSAVPVFFIVYDLEKEKVAYVSDSFFDHIAKARNQETDNTNFWNYILPKEEKKLKDFLKDLGPENNYVGRIEVKAKSGDQKIRELELSMHPIEESMDSKGVPGVLAGHMRDITHQKDQEEKAEKALSNQNNIINILSHDLRAPFHHICSIIGLLNNQMTEEDKAKYGKYMHMLSRIGERSDALLDRLTDIAQLQAWSQQPNFKLHDLRVLVKEIIKEHLKDKSLTEERVVMHLPDYAAEANVDEILFKQVITNLLSNALKFTHDDKLIQVSIFSRENKMMVVEFKDEGQGIPKPKLDKLFTEPAAVRSKGLKGEKSVGLGLQITRQLIELHEGTLEVASTQGKGSIFSVCIPLPDVAMAKEKSKAQMAQK